MSTFTAALADLYIDVDAAEVEQWDQIAAVVTDLVGRRAIIETFPGEEVPRVVISLRTSGCGHVAALDLHGVVIAAIDTREIDEDEGERALSVLYADVMRASAVYR